MFKLVSLIIIYVIAPIIGSTIGLILGLTLASFLLGEQYNPWVIIKEQKRMTIEKGIYSSRLRKDTLQTLE